MRDEDYIHIAGWMRNLLGLSGNDLLVYAVIFSFSRDGESQYKGGIRYLQDTSGASKNTVIRALESLVEKGLILKHSFFVNGVLFNNYSANLDKLNRDGQGVPKMGRGCTQNGTSIIQINNTNNIPLDKSIDSDKSSSISLSSPQGAKTQKKFLKPTVEEVKAYCTERGNLVDAEKFYDFYEAKGWVVGKTPMKDWKAAVRTWERGNSSTSRTSKTVSNANQHTQEELDELNRLFIEKQKINPDIPF